jgi:hypothetical protein
MRTSDRLKLEAIHRVLEVLHLHPDPSPAGREATARLQEITGEVQRQLGQRLLARQAEGIALADRERVAGPIRARLARLRQFAAAAAVREGNRDLRLVIRLSEDSPRAFAGSARAILAAAEPRLSRLLSYGLPSSLVEEVTRDLARFEDAMERRAQAAAANVAAGQAITALAGEAYGIVRHLDVLAGIRFADDPARLAEWGAARAIIWPGSRACGRVAGQSTRLRAS